MSQNLSQLPEWPAIVVSEEEQWAQVYGQHDTYPRLVVAEIIRALLLVLMIVGWLAWLGHAEPFGFIVLAALTCFFAQGKAPLIICNELFPSETSVFFQAEKITINGKHYQISPQVDAQFRASAKYLDERKEQRVRRSDPNGRLSEISQHKVRYRKVEMIYGGNIELIAVVSDEDKAAQLVYVLQEAWNISRLFREEQAQRSHTDVLE